MGSRPGMEGGRQGIAVLVAIAVIAAAFLFVVLAWGELAAWMVLLFREAANPLG